MKRNLWNLGQILIGNFILALGVSCFVVPNNILSGGVAGVSIALEPLIPFISPNNMITLLTIVLFIFGGIFLGKGFFLKTLISTIVYPLFVYIISYFMQGALITENALLASLYSGILSGAGVGIVFRTGASTGGMDIPALIIHKWTNIPLSTVVMVIDGLTVLLGITTHSLEAAMIGLISVWSCSYVIDWVLSYGGQKTKSIMIISDHYDELIGEIRNELDRSSTLLEAEGTYTREKKKVLLVVVENKQYPILNRLILSVDPNAFIIVQDAHEIQGNGFTLSLDD